jgi:arylsulfatase A-like enzyme/Flp pilus assembly protein TadD
MAKRTRIILIFSLFFLEGFLLFVPDAGCRSSRGEEGLNVLLITIDTLRADRVSGMSGKHLPTPNMDRLAERGVVFMRAFAHNPTTLPSHANILLGLLPLSHGVRENANFIVRQEFLTLAEHLKNQGYVTAAFIGGFPLASRFGLAQGFDIYDENYETGKFIKFSAGERKAEAVIDPALKWLDEQNSPWFLWIHCYDPHDPYEPPDPFRTRYADNLYDGEVAYVDHELGKILVHLGKKDLFDRTLIVFTGDHGESLGQHNEMTHGYLAYNTTLWVPLIVCTPGIQSRTVSQNVCHIDIFPTVCEILGMKKPPSLQGISLLPALKGKKLLERTIYFESLYPYYSRGWAPIRGFIEGDEKYIQSPLPEVYDLDEDFDERFNLAESKNMERLDRDLDRIMKEHSRPESGNARELMDRETLTRLKSLGYVSSPRMTTKKSFGPEDDVKSLLPYHNKAMQSWELFLEGKVYDALDLVKEVITERKDVDIAYTNLAKMYIEQGKVREALEVLKMGLSYLPDNYGIIIAYVGFLNTAGQDEEIIRVLSDLWLPQMEHDPEIWNYLGLAYINTGDLNKALEALEQALAIDENFALAWRNVGNVYLTRFQNTKDKDTLRKAIQNYQRAVESEPDYGGAYNSLGVAYKEAGKTEEAIQCWQRAFELRPDVGYPLLNLGLAYMEKGDKSIALDYFEKYKRIFYPSLSDQEKRKIDAFIQRCKRIP